MITVSILQDIDVVKPTDWMRPLSYYGYALSMDGHVQRFSCYSGTPQDHCEWVLVKDVLGECWHNKTVANIRKGLNGRRYEFMRGKLPKEMIWDWRAEKKNRGY